MNFDRILKWFATRVSDRLDDSWTADLEAVEMKIRHIQGKMGHFNQRLDSLEAEIDTLQESDDG